MKGWMSCWLAVVKAVPTGGFCNRGVALTILHEYDRLSCYRFLAALRSTSIGVDKGEAGPLPLVY